MTSVAQFRARDYARIAYLFVIEGVPYGWATEADLLGSSDDETSWIALSGEVRTILGGLSVPDTISFGLEGSLLTDAGAEFVLHDLDGTVAALFGSADPEDLQYTEERLPASSAAAPATVQALGGGTANLWGRQIGAEAIGPAGERQYYPCIPQAYMPGRHHAATSQQIDGALVPVPVTYAPYILEGRRCALYRLYYDTEQESWPIWELQYDDGGLLWWGTLRVAGSVTGKAWTIRCDGPDSWLRKTLNALAPDTWIQGARPEFVLADSEAQVAGWIRKVNPTGVLDSYNGEIIFDPTYDITQTDPDLIRVEIDTFLAALTSDGATSLDGVPPEGYVELKSGSIRVQIDNNVSGFAPEVHLVMHEKVWLRIGFDPRVQARSDAEISGPYDVDFRLPVNNGWQAWTQAVSPPDAGYWEAIFRTRTLGIQNVGQSAKENTNNALPRVYQPVTVGGVDFIDRLGTQKITLGVDSVYLESQQGRPPSDLDIDGTDCDSSRWWLLRGAYRESADTDPITLHQVAKCSWVGDDGLIALDTDGFPSIKIERLEDPRHFGIHNPTTGGVQLLSRVWALPTEGAGKLEVLPLAVLRYSAQGFWDFIHHVLIRLLVSTGTGSISGFEDGPVTLSPGDNGPLEAVGIHKVATDAEIADLGLAIPRDLIDWHSFKLAMDEIPGGWSGALGEGIIAWSGVLQSQDLIQQILESRGLALGLANRKYTLFPLYADIAPGDADAVIGTSSLQGDPTTPGTQPGISIRAAEPIDQWKLQTGRHPETGQYSSPDDLTIPARDAGATTRQGRLTQMIPLIGLSPLQWQVTEPSNPMPPAYTAPARELYAQQASVWRAKPHNVISVTVKRTAGQDLYPGSTVRLTSPWPPNFEGGYGYSAHPARVLRATHHLDGGHVDLDLMVQGTPGLPRVWAPIARVVDDVDYLEERYDASDRTFYCHGNAWSISDANYVSDVKYFVEPAWSDLGGDALVYGWQSENGQHWTQNFEFAVQSVNTTTHTITHTVGSFSGTFYNRMYTILVLAPYAGQTADWPKAIFSVVTDSGGFVAIGTMGWKLLP